MTRQEMIELVQFIAVICPQQKIDRATAIPWYEVIGDLSYEDARNAVIAVKHYQPFVDTSDIVREVKRARGAKPYERTVAEALEDANRRPARTNPELPSAEFRAVAAALGAGVQDEVPARRERDPALDVACPWCGAGIGNRCRNPGTGRDKAVVHEARAGAAKASAA